MRWYSTLITVCIPLYALAHAQQVLHLKQPIKMELQSSGAAASGSLPTDLENVPRNLNGALNDIPVERLSLISKKRVAEYRHLSRSAKDVQIYKSISPSVVLIATKSGLGSGSLVSTSGQIITNWHVVRGFRYVAVIFKPTIEGKQPTRDDMRLGQVVKYDEIADLALIKVAGAPKGRSPIRLGDASDIAVGEDVHAIGHPIGESWSYTTGIISQYRLGYAWQSKDELFKHRADIIQTQTPISPGNSGGPLLDNSGALIGVNSFKAPKGEALNFAVSVSDVKKFLVSSTSRTALNDVVKKEACRPRVVSKFRSRHNDAMIVAYDMFCTNKVSGEYVIPDKPTDAIFLRVDRNGDGKADVIYFDLKRRGKWDISFWDDKFIGRWSLVGYHDDGSLRPSRFESFATYQRRLARR